MSTETHDAADQRSWLTARRIQFGFFAVTVAAGSFGTYLYLDTVTSDASWIKLTVDSIFTGVGFLVLNSGPFPAPDATESSAFWFIVAGRASGVIFFSYTALLGYRAFFSDRVTLWRLRNRNRLDPFWNSGDYVIVCGVGEKGFSLARELLDSGHDVVAIDTWEENPFVTELRNHGAAVLHGDATRVHTLKDQVQVEAADEIFVNCGSDRTNADVTEAIAKCVNSETNSVTSDDVIACHVHARERRWRRFVRDKFGDHGGIRLQMYDTANATARELLRQRPIERFDADSYGGRTHVTLIGWNDVIRAITFHLCQRMHYTEAQDRAITIVCPNPDQARQSLYDRYPALDTEYWSNDATREFVEQIFPDISFIELPANPDVLLSKRFSLYDRIDSRDTLTIVVADNENVPSEATLSTMLPRLEDHVRTHEIDTRMHYFVESSDSPHYRHREFDTDELVVRPFYTFLDSCTPDTVRGERRDHTAKRIALFFHLLYEFDPSADQPTPVDTELDRYLPIDSPDTCGIPYSELTDLWDALSDNQIDVCADLVWHQLTETNRDSNRYAADHARVKHQLADVLASDTVFESLVEQLGALEHRRWSTERLLDGWEPLPETHICEWNSTSEAQDRLRAQKYHLDLRPLSELNKLDKGAKEKDIELVQFILTQLDPVP